MKHLRLVLILGLALLACACSTSNQGLSTPDWGGDRQFSVVTEEGLGTFTPNITVNEDGTGASVVVSATAAENLEAAYVHLKYDSSRYTPERVEFGSFLGDSTQVLNLALTNLAGEVPVGIRQIPSTGVRPVRGQGTLATVFFRAEPFTAARAASCSPGGPVNAVDDLAIVGQSATTATLRWTEHNVGDYDNNSIVGITDLTPLGNLFNQTVATAPDPIWAAMVDGDGNGVINIADMTPIGANWGSEMNGYILYTNTAGDETYGDGLTVQRDPFFVNNKTPVVYTFTATVPSGTPLFLSVKPAANNDMENPGPQSNVANVVIDPGPPAAPTALLATSDASTGVGNVKLDWTASASTDLEAYEVWHKKTAEDDSAWALVYDSVPANQYTYTDSGLTIESWDFRVLARDFTDQVSDPSNVISATPFAVPPPDPPINVLAIPSVSQGSAIDVSWDPPAAGGMQYFRVYRKAPGDTDFSMVRQTSNPFEVDYTDTGLTAGQTYEYYITSVAGGGALESVPSATVSSQPSVETPIQITDFTTDKTTHFTGGGEPASNITVTTDSTPDSVDWTATLGGVTGSGTTATWSPPGGSSPQVVTITCTVHKGTSSDNATLKLYLTEENIKTAYGNSGNYIDFSNLPSNHVPNTPYRPFSWYVEPENVLLVNAWGLW